MIASLVRVAFRNLLQARRRTLLLGSAIACVALAGVLFSSLYY